MACLTAIPERVYMPLSKSMEISMLPNSAISMETASSHPKEDVLVTKTTEDRKIKLRSRRRKMTVPKVRNMEDSEPNSEEATEWNGDKSVFSTPDMDHGIRFSDAVDEDTLPPDVLAGEEDYRRFSGRRKIHPAFYGVNGKATRGVASRKRGGANAKGSRRQFAAKRALIFDPVLQLEKVRNCMTGGGKVFCRECGKFYIEVTPLNPRPEKMTSHADSYKTSGDTTTTSQLQKSEFLSPPRETPNKPNKCVSKEDDSMPRSKTTTVAPQTPPTSQTDVQRRFPVGTMLWGKLHGYDWWPGCVISYDEGGGGGRNMAATEGGGVPLRVDEEEEEGEGEEAGERNSEPQVWLKWYGDNQLSQISADKLDPFDRFSEHYLPLHMKGLYKKAVISALKEAAKRSKMEFLSRPEDKKPRWTVTETCPEPHLVDDPLSRSPGESPPKVALLGSSPDQPSQNGTQTPPHQNGIQTPPPSQNGTGPAATERKRSRKAKGRERGVVLLTALEQEMIDWALGGFLPMGAEGLKPKPEHNIEIRVVPMEREGAMATPGGKAGGGGGAESEVGGAGGNEGEEPPRKKAKVMLLQIRRKARFDSVTDGRLSISELCLGCGDMSVMAEHPLFNGGMCKSCKEGFMECAYLFDDDGTQMYCTICSGGEEVFMCDAENCAKVYCGPCIEKLCGLPELEKVRAADQWLCYMCCPDKQLCGLLSRRDNWDKMLQELFANDHEMEYEPPPFYPPISPEERKPLRVLGLFDGIGTGLLVLKELGFEVDRYVGSEIDPDAVKVSQVQHHDIIHVGNIERITEKQIEAWGPFDLVIGGSPCNDLSIVNPARKGIYEGTGRLFFEFFRLLSFAKPPQMGEQRPFFWLYENVVSMRPADKQTISRFLQCNPVVVDARDISAAHRARYFWGNLPGMNRPTTPLPGDRLSLQECLEPYCFRTAQFTKLRTITTKMNSIKQTKKAIYPVKVEGGGAGGEWAEPEGDVLWCTEMERLFGFPDHYTDVANLGRCGRQRLLGKAWSVPVIRHLFSPMKDYFKSTTTRQQQQHNNSKASCAQEKER